MYLATGGPRYEISVFDRTGRKVRTITRDVKPRPVPHDQRARWEADAEEMRRLTADRLGPNRRASFEFPEYLSPVARMVGGEGYVLARRGDADTADPQWTYDIFREGRHVGFVRMASGVSVRAVMPGWIIAVEKGAQNVEFLALYSLHER